MSSDGHLEECHKILLTPTNVEQPPELDVSQAGKSNDIPEEARHENGSTPTNIEKATELALKFEISVHSA